MRIAAAFFGLSFGICAGAALAREPYEGAWGDAGRSCAAEEYRLGIAGNRFDWYETHCTAQRLSGAKGAWRFAMRCSGEGRSSRAVTRVSLPSPNRLVIENAPVGPDARRQVYKRCGGR
jgi:hypothetical protein